ncbi:MAG: hypothetical protein E4H14_13265 [Candidatus Thorarchaeota archaeon]|nr:MAG: hypothetical protein E4H14_13265 [Candidatus Thorarchaeota archaeon]
MSIQGRFRLILNIAVIGSIIGLVAFTLLTTSPLQDILFLVEQIQTDTLLIDFTVIIFGIVGFLYFFILPGLPYLLASEISLVSLEPKDILGYDLFWDWQLCGLADWHDYWHSDYWSRFPSTPIAGSCSSEVHPARKKENEGSLGITNFDEKG